jgi:ribonuclease J
MRELVYLPLGGAGEIGMNMYLYGLGPEENRRWLIVDCGVTFGDMSSAPGVDLVLPDISYIEARRHAIDGIVITHAHEDHIGALGRYWKRLRAPVYCTAFTAEIAKRKLGEEGLPETNIKIVDPRQRMEIGAFDVEFFPMTHSIPDANAVVLRTPAGTVFHTGDFKFDHAPALGAPTDAAALKSLGDEGVDFLACDSTNVFEEGVAGSEEDTRAGLAEAFQEAEGAIAATSFASNIARLKTLGEIARENNRSVVIVGRAMRRMIETAVRSGKLTDFPETISEDDAASLPTDHVCYLVTGSQGEARAALSRIAMGTHPSVSLGEGDLVIYSSKTIPGNERDVHRIYNLLSERGVRVIDADMSDVHVSGHACREELLALYRLLQPTYVIPLHGEHRHLVEHARMAEDWGVADAIIAPNGTMVELSAGGVSFTHEEVATGRVYLDGAAFVGANDGVIRRRLRLARQGHVAIALVVDDEGELVADPQVKCLGLPIAPGDWPAPLEELIAEAVESTVDRLEPRNRRTDGQVEDAVSAACRRICDRHWRKKPEVTVMVTRLEEAEQ